jgi:hypothetical protein
MLRRHRHEYLTAVTTDRDPRLGMAGRHAWSLSSRPLRLAILQHGFGDGHETFVAGAPRAVPPRPFSLSQAEVAQIYRATLGR